MKKINTKPDIELCDGCVLFTPQYPTDRACIITIPYISEKLQCPCGNCIVKSMCNRPCNEFDIYERVSHWEKVEEGDDKCRSI